MEYVLLVSDYSSITILQCMVLCEDPIETVSTMRHDLHIVLNKIHIKHKIYCM